MDSISSVIESEESNEFLMVSEEFAGYRGSEMASKGSADCGGSEGIVMVIEVQWQAQ